MANTLFHVVLMTFHQTVAQETREAIREKIAALGPACGGRDAGILYWRADWNLDQRKGYHLMLLAIFDDETAFHRFRLHPAHVEFGTEIRQVADWIVGDIKGNLPSA